MDSRGQYDDKMVNTIYTVKPFVLPGAPLIRWIYFNLGMDMHGNRPSQRGFKFTAFSVKFKVSAIRPQDRSSDSVPFVV